MGRSDKPVRSKVDVSEGSGTHSRKIRSVGRVERRIAKYPKAKTKQGKKSNNDIWLPRAELMRLKWMIAIIFLNVCIFTYFTFSAIRNSDSPVLILRQLIVWTMVIHAVLCASQRDGQRKGIFAFCPDRISNIHLRFRALDKETRLMYLAFLLFCEMYRRGVSLSSHIAASELT